jgi:LCP family protein required for cell wall assembly
LVIGSDARPKEQRLGRADGLMLVRVDADDDAVAMLSIPRNLAVRAEGMADVDEASAPLQAGGIGAEIKSVSTTLDVPIHHVIFVRFGAMREVVDVVGGVTVDNPHTIVSNEFDGHRWAFRKGEITLDGRRALRYVRVRTDARNTTESDSGRMQRQQLVLAAVVDELRGWKGLTRFDDVADVVGESVATDLSARELLALVRAFNGASEVTTCRLGGRIHLVSAFEAPRVLGTLLEDSGSPFPRIGVMGDEALLLVPAPANDRAVDMFMGTEKPRRLRATDPAFPVGCTTEDR